MRRRPDGFRTAPLLVRLDTGPASVSVATRGQTDMRGLGTAGRCSAGADRVSRIERGTEVKNTTVLLIGVSRIAPRAASRDHRRAGLWGGGPIRW